MNWREKAACRGSEDPVFDWSPNAVTRAKTAAKARDAYCQWCPVTAECQAEGDRLGSVGVWGGLSDDERKAAVRREQRWRAEVTG
jgi:hypothetical protein